MQVPVPIQDYFRALEHDAEVGAPDPVRLARALRGSSKLQAMVKVMLLVLRLLLPELVRWTRLVAPSRLCSRRGVVLQGS